MLSKIGSFNFSKPNKYGFLIKLWSNNLFFPQKTNLIEQAKQ